jgi:phenylpropionate dioxygenase-like ring-hydroxylating dioxygenase large terminal subunit
MHELLAKDTIHVRDFLLDDQNDYFEGDAEHDEIPKEKYLSTEYFQREVEMVWGRTWQIACREEQIPDVGDYYVYEINDKSLIIVRTAADQIKAYYNACPHRGRTFCEEQSGHVANFRCKFHGMMWRLDGRLGFIPARWDFPHIKDEEFGLPEAKTATWQGFVFINMDPDSVSFEDYIGDLGEHVVDWDFANRYIAAHVCLLIPGNWKVVMEAFLEDYHSMATHPQALPYVNTSAAQYSVWKDRPHYSRLLFAMAVASPYVADSTSEEHIFQRMREDMALPGEDALWTYNPEKTARQHLVEIFRARMTAFTNGRDLSKVTDSELVDAWVYPLFPNVFLWGGYSNLFYRFRPWKNDPAMTAMEVIFLMPSPKDQPRPPPAKMTFIEAGGKFSDAPELGMAGPFLDQDLGNIAWVQKGLHSTARKGATISKYQESQIRHFHSVLDMYMNGERPKG